jgi:predicted glycosyltransferase
MRVWIDLHNSPHPLLFAPVARRLENLGHEVVMTARDNAQTLELARERWPDIAVIGGPSPSGRMAKAAAVAQRIGALRRWATGKRLDVALSHNSYAQISASRLVGIPTVTAMDYEHQPANHLAFRLADRILIPSALPRARVRPQGAGGAKTTSYPGLKEEIYLGDFEYDASALGRAGVDQDRAETIVITRPPPSGASYHRVANHLYTATLEVLAGQASVCCVALTRTAAQRESLTALGLPNFRFPRHAVDARSLMYAADLVVGAGGTMTREAALLGLPTYSVFAGPRSAVDDHLVERGLLRRLERPEELAGIVPRTRAPAILDELRARAREIIECFVQATVETATLAYAHRDGHDRRRSARWPAASDGGDGA